MIQRPPYSCRQHQQGKKEKHDTIPLVLLPCASRRVRRLNVSSRDLVPTGAAFRGSSQKVLPDMDDKRAHDQLRRSAHMSSHIGHRG